MRRGTLLPWSLRYTICVISAKECSPRLEKLIHLWTRSYQLGKLYIFFFCLLVVKIRTAINSLLKRVRKRHNTQMHIYPAVTAQNSPLNSMVSVCYGLQMNAISCTFSQCFCHVSGEVSVCLSVSSVCMENSEPHWSPVHINALPSESTTPGASKARPNGTSQLNTNKTLSLDLTTVCVSVHTHTHTHTHTHL